MKRKTFFPILIASVIGLLSSTQKIQNDNKGDVQKNQACQNITLVNEANSLCSIKRVIFQDGYCNTNTQYVFLDPGESIYLGCACANQTISVFVVGEGFINIRLIDDYGNVIDSEPSLGPGNHTYNLNGALTGWFHTIILE